MRHEVLRAVKIKDVVL